MQSTSSMSSIYQRPKRLTGDRTGRIFSHRITVIVETYVNNIYNQLNERAPLTGKTETGEP